MDNQLKLCACGCGQEANKGRTFINHHCMRIYTHSEERKRKISIGNKGKKLSEETKRKISLARIGKYKGKENPFYGKKHSEESSKKMSESRKGIHN